MLTWFANKKQKNCGLQIVILNGKKISNKLERLANTTQIIKILLDLIAYKSQIVLVVFKLLVKIQALNTFNISLNWRLNE